MTHPVTAGAPTPHDNPHYLVVGEGQCTTLMNTSQVHDVIMQMPLPGIVIFVHGVNSDGEWYDQAERGLCAGLNARMARTDQDLVHCGPAAGQLTPAEYLAELTPMGFLNPKRKAQTFITRDDSFSPVIRFRFGYKASPEELQEFGDGIYLNEENYWGGGPFANGCTTLADLWSQGLSDELFLFLTVQHLNPTNDRNVYACPPRPYYVLAARRLALLVRAIREKQADVPITIVCHSQGNMVGMAAAFLGDAMEPARDARGARGRCVADSYVLCNPPYSLVEDNGTESWTQRSVRDEAGNTGRQSLAARTRTLAAFFEIVGRQRDAEQPAARIEEFVANRKRGFTIAADRAAYGLGGHTAGRVTLYCNPHDQVISAVSVQGIGWRGMSAAEIAATAGQGVFTQRVFAQGWTVGGEAGSYHYWRHHYRQPRPGSQAFWVPASPAARYSVRKGLHAGESILGRVFTVVGAPLAYVGLWAARQRVNALPPVDWELPLQAPALAASAFKPQGAGFARAEDGERGFDEHYEAPGTARDPARALPPDDPYAGVTTARDGQRTDAGRGDAASDAARRYEDRAYLRMEARRTGRAAADGSVPDEDNPQKAGAEYTRWRGEKIRSFLADNIDSHATDHSTILTNPLHAQQALAYDVAIGMSTIRPQDMRQFRIAADWRLVDELDNKQDPQVKYFEYFRSGKLNNRSVYQWATESAEGRRPPKIIDQRVWPRNATAGMEGD